MLSTMNKTLHLDLGDRSYPIHIGAGLLVSHLCIHRIFAAAR